MSRRASPDPPPPWRTPADPDGDPVLRKPDSLPGRRWRRRVRPLLVLALLLAWGYPLVVTRKPEPLPGTSVRSPLTPADSALLLVDHTRWDPDTEQRVTDQTILDAMLAAIGAAEEVVVADFFLWNDWQGASPERHRRVAEELARALIARRLARPDLTVLVLTDPINAFYGDTLSGPLAAVKEAGIPVVTTDLSRLPPSNPWYEVPARFYHAQARRAGWLRRGMDRSHLSNPLHPGGPALSLPQWGRLLRFKANHRKVLITDRPDGRIQIIVSSWNPSDASSAHSNLGLEVTGPVAAHALASELDLLEASSPGALPLASLRARLDTWREAPASWDEDAPRAEWNTEGKIRDRLISMLDTTDPGCEVRIALFYLSDRGLVRAIRDAAERGVKVRLILDPNRDAFGRKKIGIPNRPVAAELLDRTPANLAIRWASTHGEQFHGKAISVTDPSRQRFELCLGSANWTRRNLRDLNLEANLYLLNDAETVGAYNEWFDRAWENHQGLVATLDPDAWLPTGPARWVRTLLYRIQETTGFSSF